MHFFLLMSIPILLILFITSLQIASDGSEAATTCQCAKHGAQQLGCPIQTKVCEAQLYREVDPSLGLRRGCFYMRSGLLLEQCIIYVTL